MALMLSKYRSQVYGMSDNFNSINEPHHEKTRFLPMRKQRRRSADQHLCFCYMDSTIPLLLKSKITGFWPFSVAALTGLCQTWLETPKTGFLMSRLKCKSHKHSDLS